MRPADRRRLQDLLEGGDNLPLCRPAPRHFRQRPVMPAAWPRAASLALMGFALALLAVRFLV